MRFYQITGKKKRSDHAYARAFRTRMREQVLRARDARNLDARTRSILRAISAKVLHPASKFLASRTKVSHDHSSEKNSCLASKRK